MPHFIFEKFMPHFIFEKLNNMMCNCVSLLNIYISILLVGNAVGVSSNSYRFNIFPEAYLDISSQTIEVSSTISKYLAKRESIDLRGKIIKLNFF